MNHGSRTRRRGGSRPPLSHRRRVPRSVTFRSQLLSQPLLLSRPPTVVPLRAALLVLVLLLGLALGACGGVGVPPPAEAPSEPAREQASPDAPAERDDRTKAPDDASKDAEPQSRPPPHGTPDAPNAVVERIVDGDTLEVRGLGGPLPRGRTVRVRLLEIDAPELGTCFGDAATDRLTALAPPGSRVRVERDQELEDRYGRYLLYVWNAEGRFVNRSLVKTGHAKADLYPPNDKYWPTIARAGDGARQGGEGLWSACPRKPRPPRATPPDVPRPDPPDLPEPDDAPESDVPEPDDEDSDDQDSDDRDFDDQDSDDRGSDDRDHVPEPPEKPEPPADTDDSYPPGPPPGPDVDCDDLPGPVRVGPDDPHRLDADGDGIGCEPE